MTMQPSVSILLPIYNANMEWLEQLLISLNNLRYDNYDVIAIDDCSNSVDMAQLVPLFDKCLVNTQYTLSRNDSNIGSNGTITKLIELATSQYIAMCDQDDIWCSDKLAISVANITKGVALTYSDVDVIDKTGKHIASSITDIRRRHVFAGVEDDVVSILLNRNFVIGCTTLIDTAVAKASLPMCPYMVHDHYLALYCAIHHSIARVDVNTVQYRIHQDNQTLVLAGVVDKQSYITNRLDKVISRLQWIQDNMELDEYTATQLQQQLLWTRERVKLMKGEAYSKEILEKYKHYNASQYKFEKIAHRANKWLFAMLLRLAKRA